MQDNTYTPLSPLSEMRLEFAADPAFELGTVDVFAVLRSDGRDGERGTDDDVSVSILGDGRVYEEGLEPTP